MIGTFGKEQGREVKRVDQPPGNLSILEEVFSVVVDDVVAARDTPLARGMVAALLSRLYERWPHRNEELRCRGFDGRSVRSQRPRSHNATAHTERT